MRFEPSHIDSTDFVDKFIIIWLFHFLQAVFQISHSGNFYVAGYKYCEQQHFCYIKRASRPFYHMHGNKNDPESSLSETPGPLRPIRQMRIFCLF